MCVCTISISSEQEPNRGQISRIQTLSHKKTRFYSSGTNNIWAVSKIWNVAQVLWSRPRPVETRVYHKCYLITFYCSEALSFYLQQRKERKIKICRKNWKRGRWDVPRKLKKYWSTLIRRIDWPQGENFYS